jgi:hypothetical protein
MQYPACVHMWSDAVSMHLSVAGGHAGADPEATSAMIAKEQHKLEVLKRRQEREIQQVNLWHAAAAQHGRPGRHICSVGRHGCLLFRPQGCAFNPGRSNAGCHRTLSSPILQHSRVCVQPDAGAVRRPGC